jgi:hypothetical protein
VQYKPAETDQSHVAKLQFSQGFSINCRISDLESMRQTEFVGIWTLRYLARLAPALLPVAKDKLDRRRSFKMKD